MIPTKKTTSENEAGKQAGRWVGIGERAIPHQEIG